MKKSIIITLCVCLSILVTACSQNNDVQESKTPQQSQSVHESSMIENQALLSSGLQEALNDDVVFCVKTYFNYPPDTDLSAKTIETFKHEEINTYLYIVPRYSGSSITIESMDFDESRNEFVATGLLFESVCADDYALLLQADLPEAGPRLCVTVAYENMKATYTPVYDGRGDTVYPYIKNGVLLDEAPFSEVSDKSQTDNIPEYEIYKEQLREMLTRSEIDFPDYMHRPFSEPDKILILQAEKGHISGQQENICFLFELRWGEGSSPAPVVIGVENEGKLTCISFSAEYGYIPVWGLGDIDGDGLDEIVVNINTGGNGGAGVYESAIYKWENNELRTIYFSDRTEN